MDLVPPGLMVVRYFAIEQAAIESLQLKYETVSRELAEFAEEHTSEGGLLEDAVNDKGKATKVGVNGRLKAIQNEDEPGSNEERNALMRCLALIEAESKASKAVKEAQVVLDGQMISRYTTLTKVEIKNLVIEDKWLASIFAAIAGEVQSLAGHLAARVQQLEERYAKPLPDFERDVASFGERVEGHLKRMMLSE